MNDNKEVVLKENTEEIAEKITTALVTADTSTLDHEAVSIINQLITEQDANKQKDLTYLFNQNQTKKTMVRLNKQSQLMDALTDQVLKRVTDNPDQLSNDDLSKFMKTVSDLMERGQKQVMGGEQEAPFIQINQQNNEVNMEGKDQLNRDSREKVKNAVLSLLNDIAKDTAVNADIIDQEADND